MRGLRAWFKMLPLWQRASILTGYSALLALLFSAIERLLGNRSMGSFGPVHLVVWTAFFAASGVVFSYIAHRMR